ncbi:MAG: lactate utilization protein C [Gemmatales bacterium]|nr:MAG: lactate utilization protein C [Gemmatales bacterium]
MADSRESFLQRVRNAVAAGNRPGAAAPLPSRGSIGYQGAGEDLLHRFCMQCQAAGGIPHPVRSDDEAIDCVLAIVAEKNARNILLGEGPLLKRLDLARRLEGNGASVHRVAELPTTVAREAMFAADIGISGVDRLVAETGSLVDAANQRQPRGLSLLPPVHICVADAGQLVPDLFDLFEAIPRDSGKPVMPSCLTLITGPSKTGDIELRLVTGVHGPGEVHVVLISRAKFAE